MSAPVPYGEDRTCVHGEPIELGWCQECGDTGAATVRAAPEALELDAFLGDDTPDAYDWLIPGLIERQDRLILTGAEGCGKSTLLRQMGLQAACGIHPFGGEDFDPVRVLLLDLENTPRQLRREYRPLRLAAGDRYPGTLFVESRCEGLDLTDSEDRDWLHGLVKSHAPDMLITGPAYKMVAGDPTEEGPARTVAAHLDRFRAEYGCAVLLEAHTPHGYAGARRPERPYGASLWLRWPEFGYHLAPTGELRAWRGNRDATRVWPSRLERGGAWPWSVSTPGVPADAAHLADLVSVEDVEDRRVLDVVEKLRADGDQASKRNIRERSPYGTTKTDSALTRLELARRLTVVARGRGFDYVPVTVTEDQEED